MLAIGIVADKSWLVTRCWEVCGLPVRGWWLKGGGRNEAEQVGFWSLIVLVPYQLDKLSSALVEFDRPRQVNLEKIVGEQGLRLLDSTRS